MKKYQKINMIAFLCLIASFTFFFYMSGMIIQPSLDGKPWHLQPTLHEDSLSNEYKSHYKIFGKLRIHQQLNDTNKRQIIILVDAWGVPLQENLLAEDFAFFKNEPHVFALHQRLANRTKHAERTEFRNNVHENLYFLGGDSTEYNRLEHIREIVFSKALFCQHCNDSVMIEKIDSVLARDSLKFIAWTTQSSRTGDRDSLHHSLRLIANFVKRHPEATFIIQGTHRPTLGTPETRRSYKAHWVPVVILNIHE